MQVTSNSLAPIEAIGNSSSMSSSKALSPSRIQEEKIDDDDTVYSAEPTFESEPEFDYHEPYSDEEKGQAVEPFIKQETKSEAWKRKSREYIIC